MNRSFRSLAAWLALLGLVLHALWPLIAQARPKNVLLVPVCTVEGVTHYMELPGGRTPLDDSAARHQEHCSYCSFGDRAALTQTARAPALLESSAEQPLGVATAALLAASNRLTDARAPPFSPLVIVQPPRREHAQTGGRHAGALAASSGSRFMRIGVLLG